MPRKSFVWISNKQPAKFWRAMDWIFGLGLVALLAIELSVFYFFAPDDWVILILAFFLPLFLGGLGLYFHFWYRAIWPRDFGISNEGLYLRFPTGEERYLPWKDVDQVRLVTPEFPWTFGLAQAIIRRKDGKFERADIFGDAARALKDYFDEHFGRSAQARSPPDG